MPLTKSELSSMLSDKLGLSERDSNAVVASFYDEIILALEVGKTVKLAAAAAPRDSHGRIQRSSAARASFLLLTTTQI